MVARNNAAQVPISRFARKVFGIWFVEIMSCE
jgi:hypothetical protein